MITTRYFTLTEAKNALEERRHLRPKIEGWWKEKGWKVPEELYTFDLVAAFGMTIAIVGTIILHQGAISPLIYLLIFTAIAIGTVAKPLVS